jgi:hypothetical protein
MSRIITKIKKESLTTKLTLIIIGLTAGSGLLVPATYASFHPVTTGEIANDTIRSADISNSAGVQSVDIVNGQVGSVDIGTGQVTSGDIQDNGITSADLGNVITVVEGSPVQIAAQDSGEAIATCPSGKIITGGGFSGGSELRVIGSAPDGQDEWIVDAINEATDTSNILFPYALCM